MTVIEKSSGPYILINKTESSHTPSVDWRWFLVKTSNFSQIAELNSARSRKLQLILNHPGTATFSLNLLDPLTEYISEHNTSLICYRNGKIVWSGPIFNTEEDSKEKTDILNVTAMGWFQLLNKRILHTGSEFEAMVSKAILEERISEYKNIGEESAIQLAYQNTGFSKIAGDLLKRANIDFPTQIELGLEPNMNGINFTVPQFHNIGEQISQLTAIESGFDYEIDPVTRKLNMYWNEIRGGIVGYGEDKGPGTRFTYPGNCIGANRKTEGMKTTNREEIQGLYGVGKAESVESIDNYGLFENYSSLSDVTNTNILTSYAAIEVNTLEKPFQIITLTPKSVGPEDTYISSVPRPFDDYYLGDVVYTRINRGPRFRIGFNTSGEEVPQPIRIFGFTIDLDDLGTEHISNIQTTYTP